jgi:hypothetical protein
LPLGLFYPPARRSDRQSWQRKVKLFGFLQAVVLCAGFFIGKGGGSNKNAEFLHQTLPN